MSAATLPATAQCPAVKPLPLRRSSGRRLWDALKLPMGDQFARHRAPVNDQAAQRPADKYVDGKTEAPLAELMADPIMHAVLRRDGLSADEVWDVIDAARARL